MLTRRSFIKACAASAWAAAAMSVASPSVLASGNFNRNVPVLLYHRIGEAKGPLTITREKFEADLQCLQKYGYTTISLDTFRGFLHGADAALPAKPVVITFDDGYLDNFMNAYLLLRKYDMTAAFFIITGLVGEYDRLAVGHIREMAAHGMSIGSHTVNHRDLGDMVYAEAESELALSKAYLEGVLQRSVDFVAYPEGSFNGETGAAACEAGYLGGFTVVPGPCSHRTNPYLLNRIPEFNFSGGVWRTMAAYGCA